MELVGHNRVGETAMQLVQFHEAPRVIGRGHNNRRDLGSNKDCPDLRWHPALRLLTFVALSAAAWAAAYVLVVIISS
jgi:hypothetical protein